MPALLTRMCGPPPSLPNASINASQASASVTFSTTPRPPDGARASVMAAAPDSDVAVPTTVAPREASS
ncbi:hypothetical protein G6F35_019199 [Rhizopus arrhizus]|nr:hypothetical protein G6F35_019199 [Rhizopus arrhizus]